MFSNIGQRSRNNTSERSSSSSSTVYQEEAMLDVQDTIYAVAFYDDGRHIVSGGKDGKIRRWHIKNGKEVGMPMDTKSTVLNIAVSRDGKWVVAGTTSGLVTVWNAESHEKLIEFKGHSDSVRAVDISPGASRIATGSDDSTVCVWSLSTGERLLGPLKHLDTVVAVKFSANVPSRIATASTARWRKSVRIYDSYNGHLLADVPIRVNLSNNQSLAWASNSKQLFALSRNGYIHCLDVSTGPTLSRWPIHSSKDAKCITVARNGTFIAASAESIVSFWDTMTHKQIGSVIKYSHPILSMANSMNYNLVVGGDRKIALSRLLDILPSYYFNNMLHVPEVLHRRLERASLKTTVQSLHAEEQGPTNIEATIQEHREQSTDSQRIANREDNSIKMRDSFLADFRAREESSKGKIMHLETTVHQLRDELATSQHTARQKEDSLNEIIESLRENLRARDASCDSKLADLKQVIQQLRTQLDECQQIVREREHLVQIVRAHEKKHQCEALYAQDRTIDAAKCLLETANTMDEAGRANKLIADWLTEFTTRCVSKLETIAAAASAIERHDEALAAYSIALSLGPSAPNNVLMKWANLLLIRGSANEALGVAERFKLPRFLVYQVICDVFERDDRIMDAAECFGWMQSELASDMDMYDERVRWEFDFRRRCTEKLDKLADRAMDTQNYREANGYLSTILLLDPVDRMEILTKRNKARALTKAWEDALSDADEVIRLDPSYYRGYEMRHAALQGAGRHAEAVEAFSVMLLKLEESPNEQTRKLRHRYVDARPIIRRIINQTIRNIPRVLIDTTTGRLYNKKQQAEAFEVLPVYNELVSSMITQLDDARIWRAVKEFYRYVMLSHKWEHDEPLFQQVEHIAVYDLDSSAANIKLKTFCTLVHSLGFRWAWSDTCCVDKINNVVLQESLVAMFAWYRGSALTVVYLRGVSSQSQKPGGLQGSIWNTRAWTYQEYVAAESVQFYTEDWKPYLGLTLSNHKESSVIISEMQQATRVSAQEMAVLRPGLNRVREKLYLASMRQTTLAEDVAYSLLGIFNVSIPVIYGEGDRAVGRLLEHILTGSGDVTILAWTGLAGSYNSCLPVDVSVYSQLVPPHVPLPITTAEMDHMVAELHLSSPDLSLAAMLCHRLYELPSPFFAASRLRLGGIIFPLASLVSMSDVSSVSGLSIYHGSTSSLGDVEIQTTEKLVGMQDLLLIHPWISPLLDQEFSQGAARLDNITRALRLVVRLRQPFSALLLAPLSRVQYRRVATDGLIMVQVREEVSLAELIGGIRTVDIQ